MSTLTITVGGPIEFRLTFSQDLVGNTLASKIAAAIRDDVPEAAIDRGPHGEYIVSMA